MNNANLPNLTGLRGFASLAVLFNHIAVFFLYNFPQVAGFFLKGYLGVDLFFVLSGFIISFVYHHSFSKMHISTADYKHFIIKRVARIYPVHIFTLLIFAAAFIIKYSLEPDFHARNNLYDLPSFIANIFMVQAWGFIQSGSWNLPAWSVSAEWFAYLFISVPAIYYLRKISVRNIFILTFLIWIISFSLHKYLMQFSPAITISLLGLIPAYITGYFIFRLSQITKQRNYNLYYLLFLLYFLSLPFINVFIAELLIVPAAGLLIFAICNHSTSNNIFFGNRLIMRLGKLSYSIYLIHIPMFIFFKMFTTNLRMDNLLMVSIYISAIIFTVVAISHLIYIFIEEPLRKKIVQYYSGSVKNNFST